MIVVCSPVALKGCSDEEEYTLHASIPRHPNIVEALGIVEDPPPSAESRCQIVMELCHVGALSAFMESAPVRVQRASSRFSCVSVDLLCFIVFLLC